MPPRPESAGSADTAPPELQRLNKLLASAGLGARREVDELIVQGRVEVDGVVCDRVGTKVDPIKSKIAVDGTLLKKLKPQYFALNKPAGVLCTNRDPQGRARAVDMIPGNHRLFPIGRLDRSSVGLLILTNDGELAQQLTHPKYGVPKTYFVVVAGQVTSEEVNRLRKGIYLSDGMARVDAIKMRRVKHGSSELEITLSEGKNREIRRLLARLGHKVVMLRRLSIGPLKMGTLPEGAYRPLTRDEVAALYRAVDVARKAKKERQQQDAERAAQAKIDRAAKLTERGRAKAAEKANEKASGKAAAAPIAKKPSAPAAPADPFAWDNDDELLLASPFGKDYRSGSDAADDDDDEAWSQRRGARDERDRGEEDSGAPAAGGAPHDAVLVRDDGGARRGQVLSYEEDAESAPGGSRRAQTAQPRHRPTRAQWTTQGEAAPAGRAPRSEGRPPRAPRGGRADGAAPRGLTKRARPKSGGAGGEGSGRPFTSGGAPRTGVKKGRGKPTKGLRAAKKGAPAGRRSSGGGRAGGGKPGGGKPGGRPGRKKGGR